MKNTVPIKAATAQDYIDYDEPFDSVKTYEVEFELTVRVHGSDVDVVDDMELEDLWDDEFDIVVADSEDLSWDIFDIVDYEVPDEPGQYRISGIAQLQYTIDNLYYEAQEPMFSDDPVEYVIDADDAETIFNRRSSWVENLQVEKLESSVYTMQN